MYSNEVFVDKGDKERLVELMDEAHSILEKYPFTSDYTSHVVTAMWRAKSAVGEARRWCGFLNIKEG